MFNCLFTCAFILFSGKVLKKKYCKGYSCVLVCDIYENRSRHEEESQDEKCVSCQLSIDF